MLLGAQTRASRNCARSLSHGRGVSPSWSGQALSFHTQEAHLGLTIWSTPQETGPHIFMLSPSSPKRAFSSAEPTSLRTLPANPPHKQHWFQMARVAGAERPERCPVWTL